MYAIIFWRNNGREVYPVTDGAGHLKTFDRIEEADAEADTIDNSRVISVEGVEE